MVLPPPARSFTIPSLYDRAQLECRLYHPRHLQSPDIKSQWDGKAAVIAHPYAPLGGCFDDPVVCAVGDELLQGGWVVGTFNLRGAGESEGRTSWTAKPEFGDYISFYGFMMHYLRCLISTSTVMSSDCGDSEKEMPKLLLSGYSYGSMLASFLPSRETVLELFAPPVEGSVIREIKLTANQLCASRTREPDSRERSKESMEISKVPNPSVLYLLISPILPPVSYFTALSLLTPNPRLDTVLQDTNVQSVSAADNLTAHRSLAVYGNNDTFTSVKKLRNWSKELAEAASSRFNYREVDRAGHFWQEEGVETELRRVIRRWVSAALE